jgi:hypothetical protein
MKRQTNKLAMILVLAGAVALAQPQPPQPPGPGGAGPGGYGGPGGPAPGRGGMGGRETPPPPRASRPPLERSLPPGTWWRNPEMVQKLGINSDSRRRLRTSFSSTA